MTVWRILSFLILLTPVLTLILGLICWRYPPKGPTWALGYRSRRARASREASSTAAASPPITSWAGQL